MALLGKAALAMWWDMAPDMQTEFEHWHSHEHFPERLAIPGFLRAARWRGAGEGFFVMYELESHAVLASQPYLARLNAPSPWSTRLMPHHRNMVRTQCQVLVSHGAALGRHAWTLRLAAPPDAAADLQALLSDRLASAPTQPGLCGAHLLRHRAPEIAQTTEQKIRGGDQAADWVVVLTGYDEASLRAWATQALETLGARPDAAGLYSLSATALPADVS